MGPARLGAALPLLGAEAELAGAQDSVARGPLVLSERGGSGERPLESAETPGRVRPLASCLRGRTGEFGLRHVG